MHRMCNKEKAGALRQVWHYAMQLGQRNQTFPMYGMQISTMRRMRKTAARPWRQIHGHEATRI